VNVILKIQDREAIPVRAIPLLTNWEVLSPDELADALAGGEHGYAFHDIFAYRIEDKEVQPVVQTWWENFPCRALKALGDRIKATEISHETGYQEWRKQSLNELPAGVFVWKDEFESRYLRRYGRDGTTFMTASGNAMSEDEQQRRVALNFAPFIAEPEIRCLVLEGFGQLIAQSASRNLEQLWFVRGFYSASDNDTHWLGLHSLSPREAAALLCGRDPLVQRGCDDRCVVLLERRLTDYNETHPARRSWREWHDVAREIEAEYEKGFDEFFAELAQAPNTSTVGAPAQPQAAPPAPLADSASNAKPWLSIDQQDPTPAQPWYTPARYFARQLTMENPALLANRKRLADRVATALFNAGFKKRGGKLRFDSGTVLKALTNVTLG
jgi:hypothetical protein